MTANDCFGETIAIRCLNLIDCDVQHAQSSGTKKQLVAIEYGEL